MATQLAETQHAPDTSDNAPVERDYEAEAREHGWRPLEEFKGDPSRFTDAKAYMERADEVMPLLKKQNGELKRELADMRKSLAKASEHFSKAEQRAYERAMADIEAKMDAAVDAGDGVAAKAAAKELAELQQDAPDAKPSADPVSVKEALIDFRDANPWYDEGGLARDYADVVADKYADKTKELPPAEFFAFVAEKVRERYPDLDKPKAERRKPGLAVEPPSGRTVARGRSFNDLPPAAQNFADKWHKQGLFGDPKKVTQAEARKKYLDTYQWDDKK